MATEIELINIHLEETVTIDDVRYKRTETNDQITWENEDTSEWIEEYDELEAIYWVEKLHTTN